LSERPPLPPELLLKLQRRLNQLLEADWQDAEQGVYPKSLLLIIPGQIFPLLSSGLARYAANLEQANQKKHQDFSPEISTAGYPSYYLQNFHQTDNGYFSDLSANLYDLQVEILFGGSADPMRRRIIAPLRRGLKVLIRFQRVKYGSRCSLRNWSYPEIAP